ncbi:hypothetical protein HMPREF3149_05730 [Corynebacterium sp. HMSC05E07]|nr:hypothetical protein HMPREF3149_05730 [Corynebacterium sp. HMSC05E07]
MDDGGGVDKRANGTAGALRRITMLVGQQLLTARGSGAAMATASTCREGAGATVQRRRMAKTPAATTRM